MWYYRLPKGKLKMSFPGTKNRSKRQKGNLFMTVEKPLNILEGLAPIVGLRIREARTEKGMSQKDLVGERFSKSYISSIERGKITPSLKALEYIAKRLGVSVAYLLTGVHPGQQNGTHN